MSTKPLPPESYRRANDAFNLNPPKASVSATVDVNKLRTELLDPDDTTPELESRKALDKLGPQDEIVDTPEEAEEHKTSPGM